MVNKEKPWIEFYTALTEDFVKSVPGIWITFIVMLLLSFSIVLPFLQAVMIPTSPGTVYEQALRCYSSWAQFGIPLNEGEPLIQQAFQALDDEMVFDTAIDALVSVFSHHDNYKYVILLQLSK